MADETTKAEPTAQPEPTKAVNVDELTAQLDAIKKAQAGSDKAYQEAAKKLAALEADNERLQKEKMSEKEKAEYELAKQRAEIDAKAREVAEATSRLSKMKLMGEKGIAPEMADYIKGNTEEEILSSIDTLTKLVEKEVAKRVEKTLTGTHKPQAGAEPPKQNNLAGMGFAEIERLAREGKL